MGTTTIARQDVQTSDPQATPINGRVQKHRCLVLTVETSSASEKLVRGLIKRGTRLQVVEDPCRLLVEQAREPAGVIILAQPQKIRGLRELLGVLKQYYPCTACWRCESVNGQTRLLRVYQASGGRAKLARDGVRIPRRRGSQTAEKPASGDDRRATAGPEPTAQRSPGSEIRFDPTEARPAFPLITQDELSMLIGPDFGRDGYETGRKEKSGSDL